MDWWPFSRRKRVPGELPDYYREALKLADQKKYHEALTSFRLALRKTPDEPEIMEQMAVIYTHIGMPDEAIKYYEDAIRVGGDSVAAHYGLAFLFLRRGDTANAVLHLRAFLRRPPDDEDAAAHIEHARQTLRRLEARDDAQSAVESQPGE